MKDKFYVDNETGEIKEIEDKNEIALRKANEIIDFEKLEELYEQADIAKANLDNYLLGFKKQLLDLLREMPKGEQKIVAKYRTFLRRDGYLRETLDSKGLKAKYPDIYNEFVSMTAVNESLVIKENK